MERGLKTLFFRTKVYTFSPSITKLCVTQSRKKCWGILFD